MNTMLCPFCNYKRKESDTAPDWQCPKCHRAYNKHSKLEAESQKVTFHTGHESKPFTGQTLFSIGVMVYVIYNVYTAIEYGYIDMCGKYDCWRQYYYESPLFFGIAALIQFLFFVFAFNAIRERWFE